VGHVEKLEGQFFQSLLVRFKHSLQAFTIEGEVNILEVVPKIGTDGHYEFRAELIFVSS